MTEILEQLEINQTFFYQFILFAVFFFILSALYLKPFQKLIEKRNHKLKDDAESSAELLKAVEEKLAEYQSLLAHARHDSLLAYEKALADARSKEEAAILSVKEEIKKSFAVFSNELQEEKLKIESELKLQVNEFSDSVAQKLLAGK